MTPIIRIICLCILAISCNVDEIETEPTIVYNEPYQWYTPYTGDHPYYHRLHLINFFTSVSLGSELGSQFQILKKWTSPMKVFLDGEIEDYHTDELTIIVDELNSFFIDDFHIEVVSEIDEANFVIFHGSFNDYKYQYQPQHDINQWTHGYFDLSIDSDFTISSGHMFLNSHVTSEAQQRHLLREELTQALGLNNDIDHYPHSIFYQGYSDVRTYAEIDIEVIRLLYHPQLIPGLSKEATIGVLERLLQLDDYN